LEEKTGQIRGKKRCKKPRHSTPSLPKLFGMDLYLRFYQCLLTYNLASCSPTHREIKIQREVYNTQI
jgi:hypothetical protein